MIDDEPFLHQPVLEGRLVRLLPLTPAVIEDYVRGLADPEVQRLTGSHRAPGRALVEQWLATRQDEHDRADWAVHRRSDGAFLGEAVVKDLDRDNESAGFRIWLSGPDAYGNGYGTEATRLVVDHVLDVVGVHRLDLEVYAMNPRAQRVYEKCGFTLEGRLRDTLLWDGERHDSLLMSVLRTDPRPDR